MKSYLLLLVITAIFVYFVEMRVQVPDDIVINAYKDFGYIGDVSNVKEMYKIILNDRCYDAETELCNLIWNGYMNIMINDLYYHIVLILVIIAFCIIFK